MGHFMKLPPTGRRGVRLFNLGEFFRCHDAFEEIWQNKAGQERDYYQGLIQVAAALFKIKEEKNWRGAVTLLIKGIGHLEAVDPTSVEIDIKLLIAQSKKILDTLKSIGPERVGEVDSTKFPQLLFLT